MRRKTSTITVMSYIPLEEEPHDTLRYIFEDVKLDFVKSISGVKSALLSNCVNEKEARAHSKYGRARKVRLSLILEELPHRRGFRKRKAATS